MEDQKLPDMEGLTPAQKEAIKALHQSQKGRFFIGTSIEMKISDFKEVNKLQETNPEKATSNENAHFAICGYDPTK